MLCSFTRGEYTGGDEQTLNRAFSAGSASLVCYSGRVTDTRSRCRDERRWRLERRNDHGVAFQIEHDRAVGVESVQFRGVLRRPGLGGTLDGPEAGVPGAEGLFDRVIEPSAA